MGIISGYKPVQQPEIVAPFSLPFNEMYTALKDKQKDYDIQLDKSNALMTALGSIQNLLPKDLLLHADRMKETLAAETALRESVGEDITSPEYKQGLSKLIFKNATDPFYPTAMGNYETVTTGYLPAMQEMMKTGVMPQGWQFDGDFYDKYVTGYEGAITPDGNINRLEFKGILPEGNYFGKAAIAAKEIISQKYGENPVWDASLGAYLLKSGDRLTEADIVQTLDENEPLLQSTPDYELAKKKFFAQNPGADDAAFKDFLHSGYEGIAKIYNKNDYDTKMQGGSGDNTKGTGSTKTPTEDVNYFLQFPGTTAANSIGWKDPGKLTKYVENANRKLTKSPTPADKGINLWTMSGGINELQSKMSTEIGGKVTFEPNYDTETGRTTFIINSLDDQGNVKNILPDTPEFKKNSEHILKLQAQHEYLSTSVQRAEEFDSQARAESGYNPNKFKFTEDDIQVRTNELIDKYLHDDPRLEKLALLFGEKLTDAFKNGPKLMEVLETQARADAEFELFKGDPQYANYKTYKQLYKDSYSNGYYLQQEYGATLGTNESTSVKGFNKAVVDNFIVRAGLSKNGKDFSGITIYNTDGDGSELTSDQYNQIGKEVTDSQYNRGLVVPNWRIDEGGDGLVVDLYVPTSEGVKRVEVRDIGGVVEFLADNGYGQYATLKLMDSASKTTKRGNVGEGVGEGGDFGYIGGLNINGYGSMPKMAFKKHAMPITHNGTTYDIGSYEINVFDSENPGAPKKMFFDNMYDLVNEGYLKNQADIETYVADNLIEKVIAVESAGDPNAVNQTSGALGLMQLMKNGALDDWNQQQGQSVTSTQAMDATLNRQIGTWYLQQRIPTMLQQYSLPVSPEYMLMAYNWGIGNVLDWYKGRGQYKGRAKDPSLVPAETKDYVKKILG